MARQVFFCVCGGGGGGRVGMVPPHLGQRLAIHLQPSEVSVGVRVHSIAFSMHQVICLCVNIPAIQFH